VEYGVGDVATEDGHQANPVFRLGPVSSSPIGLTLQATTVSGAQFQILLAMERIEMIRGCYTQEDRDHHHTAAESLLKSALGVIGDPISPLLWSCYVGGDQERAPGESNLVIDDDAHLIAAE
jgi:hypothetical protein